MMNAFDQIISSAGDNSARIPSTSSSGACSNHSSSTWAIGVAGAEDDVDEVVPAHRLGEPVRKGQLGRTGVVAEHRERALDVFAFHEDVEVLGVARHAGEAREGEGAAHQKGTPASFSRVMTRT